MTDFEQNPFVYFFTNEDQMSRPLPAPKKKQGCNLLFFAEVRRQEIDVCVDSPDCSHCCMFILECTNSGQQCCCLAIRCRQHVTFPRFCWNVLQKCFRVVVFASGNQRLQIEAWSDSVKGKMHQLTPSSIE